jgi:hypothetical protein
MMTAAGGGAVPSSGGVAGDEPGAAGAAGEAGSPAFDAFFCDAKYAVFGAAVAGAPPVELPPTGDYVVHKQDTASNCLVTPDWPELGDKRYWAITRECGTPGTAAPPIVSEIWHLEHLCSDVYRLTTGHGTNAERQLALSEQADVGSGIASVTVLSKVDPAMVFHLRFEELVGNVVRWRFSPAIELSSCVEQTGGAHYGDLDVMKVVLFPCTGSRDLQSWNLISLP